MEEKLKYTLKKDAFGNLLRGETRYALKLPPGIPAHEFWSVIVYDSSTQLIIKSSQPWPSVFSTSKRLVKNKDGSMDLLFGPNAPETKKGNWIRTLPGKGWLMIMRLYGTSEIKSGGFWEPGKLQSY